MGDAPGFAVNGKDGVEVASAVVGIWRNSAEAGARRRGASAEVGVTPAALESHGQDRAIDGVLDGEILR